MKFSETSIRRPVFATVMALIIVLVGAVSYLQLQVREYPRIDEPVVNVTTDLKGASSEVIESQVTKPLEDSIAGIEGVDIITSVSRSERSASGPGGRAAPAGGRATKCVTRRWSTLGAKSDSPAATVRTASTSRSRPASLSRKPDAPARSAS